MEGKEGREREEEKERGAHPLPLFNLDSHQGGVATPVGFLLSPLWPIRPITFPGGVSCNPSVLQKILEPL